MEEEEEVNAGNTAQTSRVGDMSEDEAPSGSSAPRKQCKYGANCYRLNDDHKKQFSHPNDPDYNVIASVCDSPDNRPECKYGTLCYRKNPQHKKDFKHTSLPSKKRRKKKVENVTEVDSDQESSDDYDFDDPFLNDGSSDDYQPTSSSSDSCSSNDEEMEDDTKRTLREGKKFAKR